MNAPAKIEIPSTDIAVVVEQTPEIVLTDKAQRESFYEHIQREVDAFEPDTSTEKGRKAIKSLAYKITRTKTAIDDAGKKLNEEARARINAVDAERRTVKEKLTALATAVRQPLTDWEEFEAERVEKCRAIIAGFKSASLVTIEDTEASVRARGGDVWKTELDAELFRDMLPEAEAAKTLAIDTLKAAMARLAKEEADRAELDRLRAEQAEREERERAEREAREAEERRVAEERAAEAKRIADERAAEERRVAAEKAEAERIARAAREAAEQAQREAAAAAQREIDEANRRAAEAERAAQAERDRIAAEEAERQAEAKRLAAEQAAREADQAHRSAVMKAAKEAIMTCGVDEDSAKKIVLLIRAGEVPNVSLRF